LIDVTELFNDPDLASPLIITRSAQTIDAHGRAQRTSTCYTAVGVAQPASPRTLAMLPDVSRTSGAIEVWTQFDLKEGTQGGFPDEITWLGQIYTVVHVNPWRNQSGGSFTRAVCELKALVAPDDSFTL
jgi:hypothetical protein